MATLLENSAQGGPSDSNRALADPNQARYLAEMALADACRTLLSLGIQPGFVSLTFGRIMRQLMEASQ